MSGKIMISCLNYATSKDFAPRHAIPSGQVERASGTRKPINHLHGENFRKY